MNSSEQEQLQQFYHHYQDDGVDILDPFAKQSRHIKHGNKKMMAQFIHTKGDGDTWVEKIQHSPSTGAVRKVFISQNTGERAYGEPPSGASHIVYLRNEVRRELEDKCCRLNN